MSDSNKRTPHLGKLSVAILENYMKPILGDAAIKEIKSPLVEKELRESIASALANAEARFVEEHPQKELTDAILQLPLAELPSVAEAVQAFYERPTDTTLLDVIRKHISDTAPSLAEDIFDNAARMYLNILRQELAASVPTARSKLITLTTLDIGENTEDIIKRLDQLIELMTPAFARPQIIGNIPPRPSLVVGRDDALDELKARLGIPTADKRATSVTSVTIVRGWPGVGKTTLVNLLAHESEIALFFPDGVLWAALGENPNPLSYLATWGRAMGIPDIGHANSLDEAMTRMAAVLRDKQMLLIVDDVYEEEHAAVFKIAGQNSKTLFTTRFPKVAKALSTTPEEIYFLPVLTQEKSFDLLSELTPATVQAHPQESRDLIRDLEGLPLAIQVAGRLLEAEMAYGWGIIELLEEINEGAKLLDTEAPPDRADLETQTIPTVAALLMKSTDRLSEEMRERFAFLGAFAPKPATFDVDAMAAVWETEDPRPTIRALVDRGLLEQVDQRFQMHSLLVMHARSLLE